MRIAVLAMLALVGSSCKRHRNRSPWRQRETPPPLTAKAVAPAAQPTQPATSAPGTQNELQTQPVAQANSESPAPASDAVGDLVASVEKKYQAGLADTRQATATPPKQNFDNAFNALLESNLDIRSDDRLEKEFERITDGVNRPDLGDLALDSDAQKSETGAHRRNQRHHAFSRSERKGQGSGRDQSTHSDLPLMMTDQVAGYISYFSNRGRGTFERAFARSGRYHDMMVRILKQEGVPRI